jgi:two-component system OmpR family response regulator
MRLLIVEDEDALARGLRFNFEQEGYEVILSDSGPVALEQFRSADPPFDLLILDLMLPGMSGYEILSRIREMDTHVPVLVLSARGLIEDRMLVFDRGGDAYITKPFALPELINRVKNLIERRKATAGPPPPRTDGPPERYEFGNVVVDFRRFQIHVDGRAHDLTSREMQLLRYFTRNEGHVLSRTQILQDVWDETAEITSRTIDNFVLRLRKLIEVNPAEPRHILSVRGTGYRFVADPDGAAIPAENAPD